MPGPKKETPKKSGTIPYCIEVNQVFRDDPEKDLNYYVIKNKVYDFDTIRTVLRSIAESGSDTGKSTIIISCGANARHGKLIKLLNACYKEKLYNLSVVNNEAIPFRGKIQ